MRKIPGGAARAAYEITGPTAEFPHTDQLKDSPGPLRPVEPKEGRTRTL